VPAAPELIIQFVLPAGLDGMRPLLSLSRYGTADAVVPSALSVQVYEAWRAAAAAEAAACGSANELRTLCFEHDGGHFLPASKQVIAALVLDPCCCCSV
jgi:hypothetical protein